MGRSDRPSDRPQNDRWGDARHGRYSGLCPRQHRRSGCFGPNHATGERSEEHTSELQSLMRNSYAVFCLTKKNDRTLYPLLTLWHTTGTRFIVSPAEILRNPGESDWQVVI